MKLEAARVLKELDENEPMAVSDLFARMRAKNAVSVSTRAYFLDALRELAAHNDGLRLSVKSRIADGRTEFHVEKVKR